MLYLNKLLKGIKENPAIFKLPQIILVLGLTNTHIKDLKKYALENNFIIQTKQGYFLTSLGEDYLKNNPIKEMEIKSLNSVVNVNLEYLKEEKTPSILTKAIRLLAKHLIEKQPLKEFSLEQALLEEVKNNYDLFSKIELNILDGKRNKLNLIFDKYMQYGLTKSLIAVGLLQALVKNSEQLAIYEKSQFQLKFDTLMLDRMIACPENFEIQKTIMSDIRILKDVSRIILNKKSENILEITKGLISSIKMLDKYTMNTQNMNKETIRLRNVIVNAKDPISLFERDIPKVLSGRLLQDCDREFLDKLKNSLAELKDCSNKLVQDLKMFIFETFRADSREDLYNRFLAIEDFLNEKELKILYNNVVDINVPEELWINRVATFINKSRVPKDWSDEDYADFKIKTKELALKFEVLESTLGTSKKALTKKYYSFLKSFLNLTKSEQMIFLREVINNI